jgi:DNA-binding NarL/FixJ family response regulator
VDKKLSDLGAIRITLADDVELVALGLESMLGGHGGFVVDHLALGEIKPTDVLLIDSDGGDRALDRVRTAIDDPAVGSVVLYSFTVTTALVEWARTVGLGGVISKATDSSELPALLVDAAAGRFVQALGSPAGDEGGLPPGVSDLSLREAEVLELLAIGRTNAEIAEQLYLSVETVKTYVSRVFSKIDVRNRTEAALKAARVDLGNAKVQSVP